MHVLNTNLLGVCFLKIRDEFSQGPILFTRQDTSKLRHIDIELPVKIRLLETVELIVQQTLKG